MLFKMETRGEHLLLQEEWVRLMTRYPLRHWATLTTKKPRSQWELQQERERFVRRIERAGHGGIWWFSALENGRRLNRTHVHMLLGGTDRLGSRTLERLWRYGIAEVEDYDPARGATYYISQLVAAGLGDVEFSENIERSYRRWQRRRSLLEAS